MERLEETHRVIGELYSEQVERYQPNIPEFFGALRYMMRDCKHFPDPVPFTQKLIK